MNDQLPASRMRHFLLLSLSLSGAGPASPAWSDDAKSVYERTAPSVVALIMADRSGQPLALGSGFVVRDNLVVTNHHVVAGAANGTARLVGTKNALSIEGVVAFDPGLDLAILKIPGLKARPVPIGSMQPAIGESVLAIGNPQGLEGTLSQGIVSGIRSVKDAVFIQITAPISPGSSGGPVLSESGSVVGVAVATLRSGQNLNFAVAAKHVVALLETATEAKPLPSLGPTRAARTDLAPAIERVSAGNLTCSSNYGVDWTCGFSIKNGLDIPIERIAYLVIFRGRNGEPVDSREGIAFDSIRPGLAKREVLSVENDAKRLTHKMEIRILSFKVQP